MCMRKKYNNNASEQSGSLEYSSPVEAYHIGLPNTPMDEFVYARSGKDLFSMEGVTFPVDPKTQLPYKPEIQVINNIFRGNPIEEYAPKFTFDGYFGLSTEFAND